MMVQAWIIKQFAPKSELATVTNLWAGPWAGTSSMLTATDSQISDFAKAAADAYNSLGWQKANPYIDFIAFDKYERDETSVQVTKISLAHKHSLRRLGIIASLSLTR